MALAVTTANTSSPPHHLRATWGESTAQEMETRYGEAATTASEQPSVLTRPCVHANRLRRLDVGKTGMGAFFFLLSAYSA